MRRRDERDPRPVRHRGRSASQCCRERSVIALAIREQRVGVAHASALLCGLGPRVRPSVDLPDAFAGDVRVDLRRADTGMPQQLLDDAQVRAALEQMRREGVAQRVRRDPVVEARAARGRFTDRPGLLPREPAAAAVRKTGPPRTRPGAALDAPATPARTSPVVAIRATPAPPRRRARGAPRRPCP